MAVNVFSDLFNRIDQVLTAYVTDISANVSEVFMPFVLIGSAFAIVIFAANVIRGAVETPIADFAWKVLFMSVVAYVASYVGSNQGGIVDALMSLPAEIPAQMIPSMDESTTTDNFIDQVLEKGLMKADDLFEQGGFLSGEGLSYYIYGATLVVATILCVILGAVWLIIAKFVFAIMLALSPLFIACLAFDASRSYFFSWFNVLLNTIITSILVVSVFAIFMQVFNELVSQFDAAAEGTSLMGNIGSLLLVGVVTFSVLRMVPTFAGQLSSASAPTLRAAMGMMGAGGSAAAAAPSAIATTGAGAASAAKAFGEARGSGAGVGTAANAARYAYAGGRHRYGEAAKKGNEAAHLKK